ncbi:MAG: MFS transporter [Candidatus Peregrinibacteria bacterium]
MRQKNVFVWALYDFSNSIFMIVFFLYFSQWLVVEKGVSDFWYNMIFVAGSALLLLTVPVCGSIADRTNGQRAFLNVITLLTILSLLGVTVVALFFPQKVLLAAVFFLATNYFYLFSFVFYNALLHDIAPRERWGRISGIGQACNWLGQIAGLLIALPFASGAVYLFGAAGRAQTFLPSVALFALLALPMLVLFRLPKKTGHEAWTVMGEYKGQWNQWLRLIRDPNMKWFLLSYFFFNDAVITASSNFPIYLEHVFAVSDSTKSAVLVGILVTSVFGALFSGWVADTIGIRKTLIFILMGFVLVFPALGVTQNFALFVAITTIMGFLYGAVWTVARTAMTRLITKEQLNFGFGFYTLAERFSTFLGPIAWGLVTSLLFNLGPIRYRFASITMAVFVVVGLYFLGKVRFTETPDC